MTISVKVLRDILLADPAVASLVGLNGVYRITPVLRPQSLPLPAITLRRIICSPVNTLVGYGGLDDSHTQLDCWSSSFDEATQIAKACRKTINAAGIILLRELDNFVDGAELTGVYQITQEYPVWVDGEA